jgi:hypothetical protein
MVLGFILSLKIIHRFSSCAIGGYASIYLFIPVDDGVSFKLSDDDTPFARFTYVDLVWIAIQLLKSVHAISSTTVNNNFQFLL